MPLYESYENDTVNVHVCYFNLNERSFHIQIVNVVLI